MDKGWLGEVVERFAEAIGAVERGNNRATAVRAERQCVSALLATGSAPASCKQ